MAIYFIQCGTNGPIKIGYTDNGVYERLKQLQTACPYELKLLWVYVGDDYSESRVHSELSQERVRGEWFHPSNTLLSFIENEMVNIYEIETKNGRFVKLVESFSGDDEITINDGVLCDCLPDPWIDIYLKFGRGEVYISTPKTIKKTMVDGI